MSIETKSQLAVALHYDHTGAQRVVAKGKGAIGAKIIELARAHDIPIEENEVLAGALSNVELGDEIPAELYKAVAEVLVFVLRLSGKDALSRHSIFKRSGGRFASRKRVKQRLPSFYHDGINIVARPLSTIPRSCRDPSSSSARSPRRGGHAARPQLCQRLVSAQ